MPGDLTRQASNHPGASELLSLLRNCSEDVRKALIDAVTGLSHLDEAPVMLPFPQDAVDRFSARIQPAAPSSTQSTLSLGTYMVGRLPAELKNMVLDFMDIRTLLRFGRTCRLARILVHEHPDFRLVTQYANNAFLGVIATRLYKWRSLGDIVQVLRTPKCHNPACHQFGELVYLPDMIRSCVDCLRHRPRVRSLYPETRVVSKDVARTYPEHFSLDPARIPKIRVRRGVRGHVREIYMRIINKRVEDYVPRPRRRHRRSIAAEVHSFTQYNFTPYNKESIWTVLNLGDLIPLSAWESVLWTLRTRMYYPTNLHRNPIRQAHMAASIAVPYLAHRGRGEVVERGVCCLGCGDNGGCMLPEYFFEEHLPWCFEAWEMLMGKLGKTQEGEKEDEEKDECQKLLEEAKRIIGDFEEPEA